MLIANYEPITESYFGKTKTLLECETVIKEIISQLRIKDRSKVGDRIGNAAVLNKSPFKKDSYWNSAGELSRSAISSGITPISINSCIGDFGNDNNFLIPTNPRYF